MQMAVIEKKKSILLFVMIWYVMCEEKIYKLETVATTLQEETNFYKIRVTATEINQQDLTVTIGQRRIWTSYCFSGGPLDKNTGCIDKVQIVNPNRDELMKWRKSKKCLCEEDRYDYYGSDSDICFNTGLFPLSEFREKEIEYRRENGHFWRHTCNRACGCKIRERKIPVRLMIDEDNEVVKQGILMEDGGIKELNAGTNYFEMEDGSYLLEQNEKLVTNIADASCFWNGKGESECYYHGNQTIYFKPESKITCSLHICITIYDKRMIKEYEKPSERRSKSLSLESAFELLNEIDFDKELLRYDLVKLVEEINEVKRIERIILESLMGFDNTILGRVLKMNVKTEKIDEQAFRVGKSEGNIEYEKCYLSLDSKIVSVPKVNNSCFEGNEAEGISLYRERNIIFPTVNDVEISETSYDVKVWKEQRKEIEGLMKFLNTEGYHYENSGLKDLLNTPNGYINYLLHGQWLLYAAMGIILYFAISITLKLRNLIL